MRYALPGLLCTAILAAPWAPDALACGDKLAVLGGGVEFQRVAAKRPTGTIVLYLQPGSQLFQAEQALDLADALERAGHTVLVAHDRAKLDSLLAGTRPDLVLMDAPLPTQTQESLPAAVNSLPVLRVRYGDGARLDGRSARAATCTVDAGKRKGRTVLSAVQELLRQRDNGLSTHCGSAT